MDDLIGIKVGDTIALVRKNPFSNRHEASINEKKVVFVGRKYFKVDGFDGNFEIKSGDLKSEYTTHYKVWRSVKDFQNNKEAIRLTKRIHEAVQYGKVLGLIQAQKICKILNIDIN